MLGPQLTTILDFEWFDNVLTIRNLYHPVCHTRKPYIQRPIMFIYTRNTEISIFGFS